MQRASIHKAISLFRNSTFEWMKTSSFWWWWVHDRGNEEMLYVSSSVKYHLTFSSLRLLVVLFLLEDLCTVFPSSVMELNWPPATFTVTSIFFSWCLPKSFRLNIGKLLASCFSKIAGMMFPSLPKTLLRRVVSYCHLLFYTGSIAFASFQKFLLGVICFPLLTALKHQQSGAVFIIRRKYCLEWRRWRHVYMSSYMCTVVCVVPDLKNWHQMWPWEWKDWSSMLYWYSFSAILEPPNMVNVHPLAFASFAT